MFPIPRIQYIAYMYNGVHSKKTKHNFQIFRNKQTFSEMFAHIFNIKAKLALDFLTNMNNLLDKAICNMEMNKWK